MKLNNTQVGIFWDIVSYVKNNNINSSNIDTISDSPSLKAWANVLKALCNSQKISITNQDAKSHVLDIIVQFLNTATRNNRSKLAKILDDFMYYLENEKKWLYYFVPIYNLDFDGNELEIDKFMKIRKISDEQKSYLRAEYEGFAPIRVNVGKIRHIFVVRVERNDTDPARTIRNRVDVVLNKFRLLKSGDIVAGGLYCFEKSENWNPYGKIDKINPEPTGIVSSNMYVLTESHREKFLSLLCVINNRYPVAKGGDYSKKYGDYFEKTIQRFNESLLERNVNFRMVYLVLTLEVLLVSSPGDNTSKISQRTALFIGRNDDEKKKIWEHMRQFYNFRSGQIHEYVERTIKVDSKTIPIKKATAMLETWTRRSILQMIFFSQEKDTLQFDKVELCKSIETSMFDRTLNSRFSTLHKKILNQINF